MTDDGAEKDPISIASVWLRTQGYALEYEAAAALRAAGFRALLGQTYRDPGTGKRRDIDVVALALLTAKAPELYAVVECKRAAKPWIVRQTFIPGPDLEWTPIAKLGVVRALGYQSWIVTRALPFAFDPKGNIGFAVVQASKGEDVAFAALAQAVNAAGGMLHDLSRYKNPAMALPVVMIDKPLMTLAYDDDGRQHLARVEWSRVLWSGLDTPTVVDVVTREAFPKYAQNLRYELGQLAQAIEDNGPLNFGDQLPPATV